jgi:hypothetical protein
MISESLRESREGEDESKKRDELSRKWETGQWLVLYRKVCFVVEKKVTRK